ncbi:MAG: hypothetical protein LC808_12705 [Actinobacteria bacterium]|nr:hypothetical protein [Actinomycetota bacterium]
MSSPREVRWRLLSEQLDALTDWLSAAEEPDPEAVEEPYGRTWTWCGGNCSQHAGGMPGYQRRGSGWRPGAWVVRPTTPTDPDVQTGV